MTDEERRRCAYHEAGHVVAAYLTRRPFISASIVETDDYNGSVLYHGWGENFRPDIEINGATRNRIEAAIMTGLAGRAAEIKYVGTWDEAADTGAQHDLDRAVDIALYMCGSGEETSAYIEWLRHRAEGLFSHPGHWAAVEAVAAALLEHGHLSGRRARQIAKAGMMSWLDSKPLVKQT